MKYLPWIIAAACLTPAWFYLVHGEQPSPKLEAAQELQDEAMYCREAVKNGSKPYGEIGKCQQLREFVAIYYAAGKPHDDDRLLFYRAQIYAWEAVAISNALYPEQADAVIW